MLRSCRFCVPRTASVLLALAALAIAAPPAAATSRIDRELMKLAPVTRMLQVCDLGVMNAIAKSSRRMPDRASVSALSEPRIDDNSISGDGGAFRSRGQWYRFTYECAVTPDHMRVKSLTYKTGSLIPESDWPKYGLYR